MILNLDKEEKIVKKFLEDNLDLTTEIDEKVRAFYNLNEEHEESGTSVSKEIVEE